MYNIIIIVDCGEYRLKAKTPLSVPQRINEVMNEMRRNNCEHEIQAKFDAVIYDV